MLVTAVIDRVQRILFDETQIRWPRSELLDWYNDALRAVVNARPDSSTSTNTFSPVPGTRQELPQDAERLIRVVRNTYAAGRQKVVTRADMDALDRIDPSWHTKTADDAAHYIYDAIDPQVFYLYPGATDRTEIELVYVVVPPEASAIADGDWGTDTQAMPISSLFLNPMVEFMLYKAYAKSTDVQDNQRASQHLQVFQGLLGTKAQGDAAITEGSNA